MKLQQNIENLNLKILQISNIPLDERKKLRNWFYKQNDIIINDIFLKKRDIYFKLVQENKNEANSILESCAYYISCQYYKNLVKNCLTKNTQMSLKTQNELSQYLLKQDEKVKINRKEQFLLDKSSIINDLLNEQKSYRLIEKYFFKIFRFKVSHTYIKRVIEKHPNIFNERRR